MPLKKWIVFYTKHPLFCGIGDFSKSEKYHTGNDWYAGMQ